MMNKLKKRMRIYLAALSCCFALFPSTGHSFPGDELSCTRSLGEIARMKSDAALVASGQTSDAVMNYLRDRFADMGTAEGRESVLEGITQKLQVDFRPGSSVLSSVKLGKLAERGPETRAFVDNITGLQQDIGAVNTKGNSEGWVTGLARRTPFIGGMVSKRLNRAESGEDAIGRLRKRVDDLIIDGGKMRDALREDQVQTQQGIAELDVRIAKIEAFRMHLDGELADMPANGPEWVFLKQVVGKLEDAEENMRSQSVVLRQGIQRSALVQGTISEGIGTLRNVTSIHLLDLESSMSAAAGAAVAEQMQNAANKIKTAAEGANQLVADNILATTTRTIEMQRNGAINSRANAKSQSTLTEARTLQEKFDTERSVSRRQRLELLKAIETEEKLAIANTEEKRAIGLGLEPATSTSLTVRRPQ